MVGSRESNLPPPALQSSDRANPAAVKATALASQGRVHVLMIVDSIF